MSLNEYIFTCETLVIDFIKTGDIMLTDNLIKALCTIAVIAVLEMLYRIYEKRSNSN